MNRNRRKRRRRPFGPHPVERVALDRDQLRAGLGTGGRKPLGCRRSVQPWIKSEAVAPAEMVFQPAFGGWIGQWLDAPGSGIDLLARLQGVTAVHEHRRLMRQHNCLSRRTGETGQPGQPFFRWGDIFVLLLIRAGNHESAQVSPRQFLTKRGQPRGQCDTALGLFECLKKGFEHADYFRIQWRTPQQTRVDEVMAHIMLGF